MDATTQRRLLQAIVAIAALLPVCAGVAGIFAGPRFLGVAAPWPADLDSHFRFLSGIFLVLGLAWWSCIPDIETKTERFRLLGVMTFAGGLARLASLLVAGVPSFGHCWGLGMELIGVPLLLVWQTRIARSVLRARNSTGASARNGLHWP